MPHQDPARILASLGLKADNDGVFTPAGWIGNGPVLESSNPASGEVIARVRTASEADYEKVITSAEKTARHWRETPGPKRGEAIRLLGQALRDNQDALGSLVALEMGKIKPEGDGEVQEMIDIADFALGQSRMLYGKTMPSEREGHRMYEQWQPYGVVGVVTAFNFPCAVYAWNACISAICGNATIWKPSPKVPLVAIAVQKIVNKVMEDNGFPSVFSLFVDGDNELAKRFVNDERVNLLSFTGSSQVGRHVGEQVAARMGRSLLELGGNNAIVVDETADLNLAIPAIVFGAVGTAGQRCTSTRRIIAHESIVENLTRRLVAAYKQVPIGDPLDSKTLMGPLIDERAVEGYKDAIEKIKKAGGDVLCGGNVLDGPGHFVEPVIARAENDWDIVQHETFGPILYVMSYKTIEEALELHNDVRQGLSSAIFTTDLRHAEYFLSAAGSDCGIANVNIGTSGAEIGGAFGGEKDTGGGRESGSDAWKAYMRRQTTTINWSSELPLAQGIKFEVI